MSDQFILGMDMKLYYGGAVMTVTGTPPSTPTLFTNVTDVTNTMTAGSADVTTRANDGWRAKAATLREMSITFEMQWKPDDAGFTAIQGAFFAGTEISIISLDRLIAVNGARGPMGNFTVTNFTRTEPLEDAVKVSVTLEASSFMSWYTVSSE